MKLALPVALLASATVAFPFISDPNFSNTVAELVKRQNLNDPIGISKAETNCGLTPCPTFNTEDQYVSTTGENAYQSPSVSDIRGPCPGLNAAANHGYLPRSGIATLEQTVSGLGAAYNLGPIVTAALALYAITVDGNPVEGVWSIGGPLPADLLTAGLLGDGQGLSYSHNNYEGDGSIARYDAYTNNGDAHSLSVDKFEGVYAVGGSEDRYTLDKFRSRFEDVQNQAIADNPYYFTGLFSTVVVVPAAYNFVINLMSNHSAEEPSGYLDGYNFKSFFAISGEPGSFVWNRGQERIPDNWYRRPTYNQYEGPDVVGDVLLGYAAYPNTFRLGGNTGTPNSFVGVSLADFTAGKFNENTLFEGDNFQCFAFQLLQNGLPDFLKGPLTAVNSAISKVSASFTQVFDALNCPQLGKFDQSLFNQFPGYKYSPTGPDTNY